MRLRFVVACAVLCSSAIAQDGPTLHSRGLHGYIGFSAVQPEDRERYGVGISFDSAVWPLIDEPLANFQIGLASTWILPDNSDNTDRPLAPEGTLARRWPERGPTWASVFQTVEDGIGYWARNHSRYGPPKFSMNAAPQCYDYEIGSPGWSFFYTDEALPDDRLGIAQLSNRLLIPPDGMHFAGNPNGEFLGYAWGESKRAREQSIMEKMHTSRPIDGALMAPLRSGELVAMDPALLVTPPEGMEVGYVPIVTGQVARGSRPAGP